MSKGDIIAFLVDVSCEVSSLKEEQDDYKGKLDRAASERDRLRAIIVKLQRHQFGRRSERLSPDQLQLALEDLAQTVAAIDPAKGEDQGNEDKPDARKAKAPRNNNRGALPEHLPREHRFIEPEEKVCPCCNGALHVIGEELSEQLDKVPATLKVIVTHRPKYGCRACEGAVVQAPAPERPIPGGMPTEGLLACIVIDKYADNNPLYRQAKRFEREGINLDRQTLCTWVGKVCFLAEPIYDYILTEILGSPVIFGDETTIPVLEPGLGRTKTGYFWAYARDERPWQGARPPGVAYIYEENRQHHHAADHLAGFKGILHCDGYGAYDKGLKKRLAEPAGLRLFLTDGRVEMDTNTVERAIRPQKLTVKNALFAGSNGGARHWAIMATLIETAKMCGVEPFAYLRDVLIRITNGHPINRIGELAPWHYMAAANNLPEQAGRSKSDLHPAIFAGDQPDGNVMAG